MHIYVYSGIYYTFYMYIMEKNMKTIYLHIHTHRHTYMYILLCCDPATNTAL